MASPAKRPVKYALIPLVCLSLPLAACGQSVILEKPAERTIAQFVFSHTGIRATNIHCPSGVPAKAGGSFQCHFTATDGKYVANMLITAVHGQRVDYFVRTSRVV